MSWDELFLEVTKNRAVLTRRFYEVVLRVAAGEVVRVFGRPARFEIKWVDGPPKGFKDENAFKEWAVGALRAAEAARKVNGG